MSTTHLFAMGGGSWTGPSGGPSPMWRHILAQTGKTHPKVCIIPTATGDRRETITDFVFGMHRLRAHPNFLSLYATPTDDLESWIMEFDAVFVIMLCDGMFPSTRSMESNEGEEEERRLFYVAVTRAKNELYLTYPLMRGGFGNSGSDMFQSPSRFLSEIPKELLNEWNLR